MKPITFHVSEPVYRQFQDYAKKLDRKTSELIREAMDEYRSNHMSQQFSLRNRRSLNAGGKAGSLQPISPDDDFLGEMIDLKS